MESVSSMKNTEFMIMRNRLGVQEIEEQRSFAKVLASNRPGPFKVQREVGRWHMMDTYSRGLRSRK
jgi:hypothetical protein